MLIKWLQRPTVGTAARGFFVSYCSIAANELSRLLNMPSNPCHPNYKEYRADEHDLGSRRVPLEFGKSDVSQQLSLPRALRDAIGAWVKVRVGNQTLSRQVMAARSYLSQSELPVTFGLGPASRVDEVTITWPGGASQKVSNLRMDALNVVKQQ